MHAVNVTNDRQQTRDVTKERVTAGQSDWSASLCYYAIYDVTDVTKLNF